MKFFEVLKKEIQTLAPSLFALVMSTGIISISSNLLGYSTISNFLFYVNNIEYAVLVVQFLIRIIAFFPHVIKDLSSHAKGAGFLTITAASCILGLQHALMKQNFSIAVMLWFFALLLWIVFMYAFVVLVVVKKEKPSLEEGLNGSWLLLVVSIQSLSILANTLTAYLPFPAGLTTFMAFAAFLMGFMFYVILITLIFQRLIFSPLKAEEFTPPDWIDMGAAAITALSGATMANAIKNAFTFNELTSFVKTLSILSWTISTWWIPIVFTLEIRRHLFQRNSFKYQSSYWSMVFPLGVYTVCTIRLAEAVQFPYLYTIAKKFIFIAFAFWLITFIGMCLSLTRLFKNVNSISTDHKK
ncbi:MAG: Tellurite resistance protein TehA [Segetibacter sp.]|nr:Tellurite resistance protein TehA [Segetibacter sp.]